MRGARSLLVDSTLACALFALALVAGDDGTLWWRMAAWALLTLTLLLSNERLRSKRLLPPNSLRDSLAGLVSAVLLISLTYLIYPTLSLHFPELALEAATLYRRLHAPPGLPYALPILVLVIVAEEMLWRGAFFGIEGRRAFVMSVMSYTLVQLASGSWLLVALSFALGAFWAVQRWFFRSLWPSLISHLLWSLFVFVLFPLAH